MRWWATWREVKVGRWWYEEEEGEREEGRCKNEEKFLRRRNLLFGGVAPLPPFGGEHH